MAVRATVNQRVQIGAEVTTTPGTTVAANKLLQCFDWQFGINADVKFYRPTGRKYDTVQEENTEWVDGTMTGPMDFNGILYPLLSACGSITPPTVADVSSYTWVISPPVSGTIAPQTYSIQQGDPTTRAHKFAYGLFTEFGYTATRHDFTCSGKLLGQPITDGATLTSSPSAIALSPIPSKFINVYFDSTSGGLGVTQLLKPLSITYLMTGIYVPEWVLNRANLGYTTHVDMAPKTTMKLKVEADAQGMSPLPLLQSGATYFLEVDALGGLAGSATVHYEFKHDMAVKVNKPASTFQDDNGVYAIEWEFDIVEDSGWGKSQMFTVANTIAGL